MKNILLIVTLCFLSVAVAQEEKTEIDSLEESEIARYIKDHSNQLNIKFEVSNEVKDYLFPLNGSTAFLAPNIGIRYALVFSYRFLSIRLGIRAKPSEESTEEKGESDLFDFKIKLLFDHWSHRFAYTRVEGYYIKNSDDIFDPIFDGDSYVQFPSLTTKVFSGSSSYKFNPKYSVKSFQSQTEIQLKSAGSFVPGIDYWVYKFDGADNFLDGNGNPHDRVKYSDYIGFNAILNAGYYYTFVLNRWYANIFAVPGAGINIYKETLHHSDLSTDDNRTDFVLSIQSGLGIGYNSEKIFFGANYLNKYTDEKNQEDRLEFQTIKHSFFIFFGYRFRAPKAISKPVRYIEKKVPVLDHDN